MQIGLFDFEGDPIYTSRDECVRLTEEHRFEELINIFPCSCGEKPKEYFRSCKEYFVKCPKCEKRTGYYKHMYLAIQAWNRGERR